MKSKIISGSIICVLTFMLTSFQTLNVSNYQLIELTKTNCLSYTTQNQTSCTKCHDCKKDVFVSQDSTNYNINLIDESIEKNAISVKKTVSDYIETIDFTDENNPDNNKTK